MILNTYIFNKIVVENTKKVIINISNKKLWWKLYQYLQWENIKLVKIKFTFSISLSYNKKIDYYVILFKEKDINLYLKINKIWRDSYINEDSYMWRSSCTN